MLYDSNSKEIGTNILIGNPHFLVVVLKIRGRGHGRRVLMS